jgi:[acyl-carrier-protein] S-malonyltransferase
MSLAFVFPGQGSQSVGMLAALAAEYKQVEATYAEASAVLGYDLWNIVSNGPAEELNQTHITQPAMLSAGVAVWRIWNDNNGAQPVVMAGHSLGEYSALVASGALEFADAVALVAERGRLMQEAVPAGTGAMAAILGLDDQTVIDVCANSANGEVVSAVNFNAPGQVVVAGQSAAVERAVANAKEAGAKRAIVLPVSVPSHCALMRGAADKLAANLAQIHIDAPLLPVINNANVASETADTAIKQALVEQLYSPVRWVETIESMAAKGIDTLIECGPGKVLIGLNKRIAKQMSASAVFDVDSLNNALEQLKG